MKAISFLMAFILYFLNCIDYRSGKGLSAGIYEVEWNANRLHSGVYYYTLSCEDFVQTKKSVLLK